MRHQSLAYDKEMPLERDLTDQGDEAQVHVHLHLH